MPVASPLFYNLQGQSFDGKMETSQPSGSGQQATASAELDKSSDEPRYLRRLREVRKQRGQARSSDEEDVEEEELEDGVIVLHKLFARRITLHPGPIVMKSGKRVVLEEAEALRIAERAKLPVPHLYSAEKTPDGKTQIRMEYVQGRTLKELWPGMSADQKKDMAQQLRGILDTMRSFPPPPDLVGACDGVEIRDTRAYHTHRSCASRDEGGFNSYLVSALFKGTPPGIRDAFTKSLRTDHRIVLTHCDISPRNIIVQDGKIKGLIDWEDAGWYPEYWEYVKFFQRSGLDDGDWWSYAEDIFSETYPEELVTFIAMSKWQSP